NVPIALNATVEIIATIKKVRALSFIRKAKSDSKIIFVFFQNTLLRLFRKFIRYTLNCVNKMYFPIITTMITGIITKITAAPISTMAVTYPATNNQMSKIVKMMYAISCFLVYLSSLINSTNLLDQRMNVTKNEMTKNSKINETSVTTIAHNGI